MKNKPLKSKKTAKGFTIIELLLATAAFSIALMVAISGFLGIGRLFYKGVSNSQANDITKQVLNDIANSIQASPGLISPLQPSSAQPSPGYNYYCIGNNRYTFGRTTKAPINRPIITNLAESFNYDPNNSSVNFGLVKDKLDGNGGACAPPCDIGGSCAAPLKNPQELLGNKMQLGDLKISASCPSGSGCSSSVYLVNLTVAYGDGTALQYDDTNPNPGSTVQCTGSTTSQQFCGVVKLSTGIYKGIHP